MNPANDNNHVAGSKSAPKTQTAVSDISSIAKEKEILRATGTEVVQELPHELEIPKEVENVGVAKVHGEVIELPPDVKKLGLTPTGASTPVKTTTALPQVILPISDQQVVVGLHTQVILSLRWLATWCIRRLKKAHIVLKTIHGKIVRVKTN